MELFSSLTIENTKLSSIKSSLLQEAQDYADKLKADKTDPVRLKIVRLTQELNKASFEVKSKTAKLQKLKEQLESLSQPDLKFSSISSISKLRTVYHVRSMSFQDQESLITKLQESQQHYETMAMKQLKETQYLEHIRIRQKESKDILAAKLGRFREVCSRFIEISKDVKCSSKSSANQLINTQHKLVTVKNQGVAASHKRVASLKLLKLKEKDLKDSVTRLTGSIAKSTLEKIEVSEHTHKMKTGIQESMLDQQESKELQAKYAAQISAFKKQFDLLNQVTSKYPCSGNIQDRVLQAWEQLLNTEKHLQIRFTNLTAAHNELIKQLNGIKHELAQNEEFSKINDTMTNLKTRTSKLANASQNFTMNDMKNYIEGSSCARDVNDGFIIEVTAILSTMFQKFLKLLKHIKLSGVSHSSDLNLFANNYENIDQPVDLSLKNNQFKLCIEKYCPKHKKKICEFVLKNQLILKSLSEEELESYFYEFPDCCSNLDELLTRANTNAQTGFLHSLKQLSELLNLVIQYDEEYGPIIRRNSINQVNLHMNKSGVQNFLAAIFKVKMQQVTKSKKIMHESETSTQRFRPLKASPHKIHTEYNQSRQRMNSHAQLPPILKGNTYVEEINYIKKKLGKFSSKLRPSKSIQRMKSSR